MAEAGRGRAAAEGVVRHRLQALGYKALAQMDEATQQNSALVEENAATAETLEQQAVDMKARVGVFRTGEASAEPAGPPGPKAPAKAARLRAVGGTALKA
jgi:methyl-accepting chemotaxis protein